MSNPLDKKPNDLAVRAIAPKTPSDGRVPLAQEFALDSDIQIVNARKSRLRKGWYHDYPDFSFESDWTLNVSGRALLPIHPGLISIETQIAIPRQVNTAATIREESYLYLVGVSAEVGAEQDEILGKLNFSYVKIDDNDPDSRTITNVQKENSRRVRAFWLLALSQTPMTAADLLAAIGVDSNGLYRLPITSKSDTGYPLNANGSIRLYAKDPNWVEQKAYTLDADTIDLIEVCRVKRLQNFSDRGYTWGFQGEEPLTVDFNVQRTAKLVADNLELEHEIYRRIYGVFAGIPDHGSTYARAIQNLTSGPAAGNPGRAGEAASAPNGSVAFANDQRTTFTNQDWVQRYAVDYICTSNDGSGHAVISYCLNTTAPAGTAFSSDPRDHKIFDVNGNEWSQFGTFQNSDCADSILWTAGDNALLAPGDMVYFMPAVRYPAGSGLSLPFDRIEKVWRNTAPLADDNVRNAYGGDLNAYEDPANGESYIFLYGPERAAIHKIYKKITVSTDETGLLKLPTTERGAFAYIKGVSGAINAPIKAGLLPNRSYDALIYHPPLSLEIWQMQLKYPEYQGTGETEPEFLEGATVISRPFLMIHTKGGGQSVFQGDAMTQFRPTGMFLPTVLSEHPVYSFNAPVQLSGDPYPGPITLNELPLIAASGLAIPVPGQTLSIDIADYPQPQHSLAIRLRADGELMGFRPYALASGTAFQAALVFAVEKDGERRLVIATHNSKGALDVALDTDQGTAIDTFRF